MTVSVVAAARPWPAVTARPLSAARAPRASRLWPTRRLLATRARGIRAMMLAFALVGVFVTDSTGIDAAQSVSAQPVPAAAGALGGSSGNVIASSVGEPGPSGPESAILAPVAFSQFFTTQPPAMISANELPLGDLPGWRQTLTEDFSVDQPAGQFPGAYSSKWMSYDGFVDTSGEGDYAQRIISAHDSMLDLHLHTENGRPLAAAPVPLVDGTWGGQTYGRFSVRLKADPLVGYGAALLLWSDANDWNEGEIDFPESHLDQTVTAANHCPGDPMRNCYQVGTKARFSDWHVYTINWTPHLLSFEVDGKTVGSTAEHIPTSPMHWVLQFGTAGIPDAATEGHVLIDWATIYRYAPSLESPIR